MENVVDRVLADRVTVGIKETEWEIAARVDCKADLGHKIIGSRRGLSPANWTCYVGGTANTELVIVLSIRAQA